MEKKKQLIGIWDVKHMFESSVIMFFIIATIIAFCYTMYEEDKSSPPPPPLVVNTTAAYVNYDSLDGCDLFSGKWVHDNHSYPLYKELECPYITGEFACQQHGRMDSNYQQWRWQPHACNLSRVIFVGDSVNRNQWLSMVCMLQSVIPLGKKRMQKVRNVSLLTFKALEYNVSVDFYWAPLLVESNADHPSMHKTNDRIVRIESIEKHAKHWVNADVLVFNSYLWWRMPELKILNGSFEEPKQYNIVDNHQGYNMVLEIWSNWLYTHINHTRTQSYFMSMTATHHRGKEWGMKGGQNC
ncbi:PC-Esterase, partial [Cynara cardunculus var. scolymus]